MIIKAFVAPSLEKALWLIGQELGPAAVILRTRFGRTASDEVKPIEYVDLTAALDSSLLGKQVNDTQSDSPASTPTATVNRIRQNKASRRASQYLEMPADVQLVEVVGW
jgi:flagellar biosynthesis GTPase FlhF